WRATTPILKKILEDAKVFTADVATAPDRPRAPQKPKDGAPETTRKQYQEALARYQVSDAEYKEAFSSFRPQFKKYQVVVSNYNGELWPKETRSDFVEFVSGGG